MRKKIFSGFIISFFLIQFLSPKKTNPVAEGKSMNAPANVSAILERSLCEQQDKLAGTNIAPVSFFIVNHVIDGHEINFWSEDIRKRKLKKFKEICEQEKREMPMESSALCTRQ